MLNKRSFRIILSLVVAVLLWAYVVGSVDPSSTKQIRNIPITINHADVLGERGLAFSGINAETMDIEVSGARLDLGDIDASDFTATVDLASATKGENELTIILRVPSGIEVTDRSLNKVVVTVDDLKLKDVDVTIVYNGTFEENQEGSTLSISNPTVTVSGAESIVDTVEAVRGTIDASRLSDTATELTCQLIPINGEGNPVSNVTLSQESVTVRSILSETKGVSVAVEIIDNSSDNMARNTETPEVIYIIGNADVIDKIDTIEAEPVDVTNIAEDTEIPLEFKLPDGVSIAEKNESTALSLKVSPLESKSITFNEKELTLAGQKGNLLYAMDEGQEFTVTLMDSETVLSSIAKENISLKVDVTELTYGRAELPIEVEVTDFDGELHSMDVAPGTIYVTASEETSSEENASNEASGAGHGN